MIATVTLRLRAVIALSAFLGSLALPLLTLGHLTLDDDRACGSVALSALSAESASPTIHSPGPVAPAEHCALCHWLRAVGGSRINGVVSTQPELLGGGRVVSAATVWRASPVVSHRVSRGPPSLTSAI